MGYAAEKSVLDEIIEVLRSLNDKQLKSVQAYVNDVASETDDDGFFRPLTKEEFFKRVDEGLADIENGRYEDIATAEKRLREEFGL